MTDKKRILLVDDDEAVVSYLVMKLAKYFEIDSTTEPRKAVDMARAGRPQLILCDIDMPDMSGGDLVAALNEDPDTAFIPVLYLTGLVSPEEASDLKGQVGGRPGISKRAPLAELLARIDELALKD